MNKKIKNATPVSSEGIAFKSKAEQYAYRWLTELGFKPLYEPEKFVISEGFYPEVLFIDRKKKNGSWATNINRKKVLQATYTPDFIFMYEGVKVIVEVKGIENDVFPLKKKLFRKHLETLDYPVVYIEAFSKRQLMEAIDIMKNYVNKLKEDGKLETSAQ